MVYLHEFVSVVVVSVDGYSCTMTLLLRKPLTSVLVVYVGDGWSCCE